MFGAGPEVFAVWGYVVANAYDSAIELNPNMLAAMIGMTPDAVNRAIDYLCQPDNRSRSKDDEGRRIVHEQGFFYRVVNHDFYRNIKNAEDKRLYDRNRKRKSRANLSAKSHGVSQSVTDGHNLSVVSPHTDTEVETETERRIRSSSQSESQLKSEISSLPTVVLPQKSESAVARSYSREFLEFWNLYPKRVDKHRAWEAWQRQKPDIALVVKALTWQTVSAEWNRDNAQYCPSPTAYLDRKRWEDEPSDPAIYVPDPKTKAGRIVLAGMRAQEQPRVNVFTGKALTNGKY